MWDFLLLSNVVWKLENVVAVFSQDTAKFLNVEVDYGKKFNLVFTEKVGFLFPPSFVGSAVAFDIKWLGYV